MRFGQIRVALALLVLVATPLEAQESADPVAGSGPRFAARVGATISPDQFHLGFT